MWILFYKTPGYKWSMWPYPFNDPDLVDDRIRDLNNRGQQAIKRWVELP